MVRICRERAEWATEIFERPPSGTVFRMAVKAMRAQGSNRADFPSIPPFTP
jgi:hypothetical protein